jgi:hypothetical protein
MLEGPELVRLSHHLIAGCLHTNRLVELQRLTNHFTRSQEANQSENTHGYCDQRDNELQAHRAGLVQDEQRAEKRQGLSCDGWPAIDRAERKLGNHRRADRDCQEQ